MKIYSIHAGNFKLDGGAMFGVVPKSLWNKINPADENNMCSWAMRCLLVEEGNRLILIDNGMGNKQDDKFFGHYYLHGEHGLDKSLAAVGFSREDITDVFLSHLHFDHCGGSIQWNREKTFLEPAFPKAVFWSHSQHWDWAVNPNPREKASFLKDNILPIQQSGQLKFADKEEGLPTWFDIRVVSGHTESMMLPLIDTGKGKVFFMADLIPSHGHLPLPWVMAYDTRPLLTLEEKSKLLQEAVNNQYLLFFEHDPLIECCTLSNTEKGIRMQNSGNLIDLL